MSFTYLTIVLIAANVLGGGMAMPQATKLLRNRRTEGVSMTWAALSVGVNAWWGAYGIAVGDLGIVPVSAVSVMAYILIAACIVRFGTAPAWRAVVPAVGVLIAVSSVPVVTVLVSGWALTGIALGALYGVQLLPAVVVVYRSIDVSGVSVATWLIAFVEASLWGVYGVARADHGILTLAATGVLMSALVLGRLFVRRPRRLHSTGFQAAPAFAPA